MNHVRRQPVAALAAICVLALVLTGCGSIRTQTQQWYTPADGVNAEAGDIALRNVLADKVRSAKAWKEAMNQFAILYGERFTGVTA